MRPCGGFGRRRRGGPCRHHRCGQCPCGHAGHLAGVSPRRHSFAEFAPGPHHLEHQRAGHLSRGTERAAPRGPASRTRVVDGGHRISPDGVVADERFDVRDSVLDNVYAATKRAGERVMLDFGERGLDVVVVNPAAVFVPTAGPPRSWQALVTAARRGLLRGVPPVGQRSAQPGTSSPAPPPRWSRADPVSGTSCPAST
ncbi:dihydroflavonol-4-reductase [Mycolicibacterium fortuitum]|uniref:Dihydroflavonol-4-reductase n=1 Tax=Mycolicibacterium fortuitum TaxID=1766 RepID=A0A378UZ21_MYCFO|nr:dihydroflavonol-4-reductase [Mycolicibacterium fortuitum]